MLLPEEEFEGLPDDFPGFNEFGMVFFARPNGECYWYELGLEPDTQIEWYITGLTPDWNIARGFGIVGAFGGFIMFLYSLSLTCTAQKQGMRYFAAFVLCVPLCCLQALTFLAFSTDFCDEVDCDFSRTSTFCTVAACLYFCSGLCFIFMTDYPGITTMAEEKLRADNLEVVEVERGQQPAEETPAMKSHSVDQQEDATDPGIVEVDAKVLGDETAPSQDRRDDTISAQETDEDGESKPAAEQPVAKS